jgi:endonuclease/exonuclease/phosphatase family metal-dependent hydrolase
VRPVRVVTLNLWNDRHQPEKRMEVVIAGLKALSPDIIGLQEVVASPRFGNQAELLAHALDAHVTFDPVSHGRAPSEGPVGNAVVSRFPITRVEGISLPSASDDPRRALATVLATPDGALPFFTCHLSWEPWHTPRRESQVVVVDEFVKAHPGDLPPILTGDFNASPDSAVIFFLTGRMSLMGRGTYYRDAYARRRPHSDGYTWSARNPHTVRWIERNRRLDYIFVGQLHESGWGAILDARVVLDVPGPEGVFASDHFGVYAEIGMAASEELAV